MAASFFPVWSMSEGKFEKEIDAQLRSFADDLKASEDYHSRGIQLCERVRKCIEQAVQYQSFSIASTHYGGSMGKATDLEDSDFDIVMKINNRRPPFSGVLRFLKDTLCGNAYYLEIYRKSIYLTKYSIHFTFTNKIKVDLLPASEDLTEEQVLWKMEGDPRNLCYYSSCLVEQQVEFMKDQSAFAHTLARLTKFWYKSMASDYYVSGDSMIFELLAVAGALEEKRLNGWGRESMSSAFIRVVEMAEDLDRVKIAFELANGDWGPWRVRRHDVWGIGRAYLLEPENWHNNLLRDVNWDAMELFMWNGGVMRKRLENLMENRQYCRQARGWYGFKVNFNKLFKTAD